VDKVNFRAMKALFKKEYRDTIRNRWLIILILVFLSLAIVVSYFGSSTTKGVGFHGVDDTVAGLISLISFLVPIVGVMLGHSSITKEREQGSLEVIMSYPVNRTEIFLGKYFALGSVLFTAIFIGFGGAGIIIALGSKAGINLPHYLLFLLATFLIGLIFLGISMLVSVATRKRSAAIAGGVFIWFFFTMIIGLILIGVYTAMGGDYQTFFSSGEVTGSEWIWKAMFFSPLDTYQMHIMLIYGIKSFFGFETPAIPGYINFWTTLAGIATWAFIPPVIAMTIFKKKDM